MAGTGSTEKSTKQKFDGFMTVLAKDGALDPKDLTPRLLIEGVISDAEHEKIKKMKSKEAKKRVRLARRWGGGGYVGTLTSVLISRGWRHRIMSLLRRQCVAYQNPNQRNPLKENAFWATPSPF